MRFALLQLPQNRRLLAPATLLTSRGYAGKCCAQLFGNIDASCGLSYSTFRSTLRRGGASIRNCCKGGRMHRPFHLWKLLQKNCSWCQRKKANALARAFQAKSSLPPPFSGLKQELEKVETRIPEFIPIRSRIVLRISKALKLDTASGPDGIPVRIYRECCCELAPAIALLIRYLLRIRCWLQIWKSHRILAFLKKRRGECSFKLPRCTFQ